MRYENGKKYTMKIGNSEVTFTLENFSEKVADKFNEALAEQLVKQVQEREIEMKQEQKPGIDKPQDEQQEKQSGNLFSWKNISEDQLKWVEQPEKYKAHRNDKNESD